MKRDSKTILRQYEIGITKARLAMLEIFLQTNEALTQNIFLNDSLLQLDRTTIFRTLNLFVDKQIIQRIPASDRTNRYLLVQKKSSVYSNFICKNCKKIIPLQTVIQPKVRSPKGCMLQRIEITIFGLCDDCNLD